jgi:hypothetical protein
MVAVPSMWQPGRIISNTSSREYHVTDIADSSGPEGSASDTSTSSAKYTTVS